MLAKLCDFESMRLKVFKKKYASKENTRYDKTEENSGGRIQMFEDLCRPNKRQSPENHGDDAADMYYKSLVFHVAKIRNYFFKLRISKSQNDRKIQV